MPTVPEPPDATLAHCVVCHGQLAGNAPNSGAITYWVIEHAGRVSRICTGCHTPEDGGVYVVVPAADADRWVPLLHPP